MRKITLVWAGGEHDFALPIGGLRAVQTACDRGPLEILVALNLGAWRIEMLESVIRHGLIGGGMAANDARDLVARIVDSRPLAELVFPAIEVMRVAISGVEDDQVGEHPGEASPPES